MAARTHRSNNPPRRSPRSRPEAGKDFERGRDYVQSLARGLAVEDTGGPLQAPVGRGILSRMFDVFGHAIDRKADYDADELKQRLNMR